MGLMGVAISPLTMQSRLPRQAWQSNSTMLGLMPWARSAVRATPCSIVSNALLRSCSDPAVGFVASQLAVARATDMFGLQLNWLSGGTAKAGLRTACHARTRTEAIESGLLMKSLPLGRPTVRQL